MDCFSGDVSPAWSIEGQQDLFADRNQLPRGRLRVRPIGQVEPDSMRNPSIHPPGGRQCEPSSIDQGFAPPTPLHQSESSVVVTTFINRRAHLQRPIRAEPSRLVLGYDVGWVSIAVVFLGFLAVRIALCREVPIEILPVTRHLLHRLPEQGGGVEEGIRVIGFPKPNLHMLSELEILSRGDKAGGTSLKSLIALLSSPISI